MKCQYGQAVPLQPHPVAEAKYAVVESASDVEYFISLNSKLGVGDSGFASFVANAHANYGPRASQIVLIWRRPDVWGAVWPHYDDNSFRKDRVIAVASRWFQGATLSSYSMGSPKPSVS